MSSKDVSKEKTESEDKINMRVAKASAELATSPLFDSGVVVNESLDKALEDAYQLVNKFVNA